MRLSVFARENGNHHICEFADNFQSMTEGNIFIIIPCFNEGQTIIKLTHEIENILQLSNEKITLLIVDDSSTDDTISQLMSLQPKGNLSLKILSLQFNLGHQGAIAQGILFANNQKATHAIVMDGDGEDDPSAIPELLSLKHHDIVHVIRGKRREKLFFRMSYIFYKTLFSFLTRKKMNFGKTKNSG